jgi:hypothetical protein
MALGGVVGGAYDNRNVHFGIVMLQEIKWNFIFLQEALQVEVILIFLKSRVIPAFIL